MKEKEAMSVVVELDDPKLRGPNTKGVPLLWLKRDERNADVRRKESHVESCTSSASKVVKQ